MAIETMTQPTALRTEVRELIATLPPGRCDAWLRGFDPEFSHELGRRGWLGLAVPTEFGGHGKGHLARYIVTEELLAAGAPVAYHWFADRQIAPTLLANAYQPPTEDTDVVLWYSMEHHSYPASRGLAGDAGRGKIGFALKPNGFFDRNPALDVPPPATHRCSHTQS